MNNQSKNLYRMSNGEVEVYVFAESIESALNKWREWRAKIYHIRPDQVSAPICIIFTDSILLL